MTQSARLAKLREKQLQATAALREAEAKEEIRQRKDFTRLQLAWGASVLALPPGERELVEPILLNHMNERHRKFVSEHPIQSQP